MITAERMAAVDRNAAALGVPRKQLMESSGNAVARTVRSVAAEGAAIAIVAGRGNNGGDAFVAARFLDGFDVRIYLLGRPATITTDIARENWEALQTAAYDTTVITDSSDFDFDDPDVIVDGMLGTGITGELREPIRTAAERINATDATVVAVDVPSGVNADTGQAAGTAVEADRVVTFHDMKPGLADRADVTVADIGIPPAAERFVGPGDLLGLDRGADSHKGAFGRVYVIGGGPYTGAPALTAQAALRGGADLAYVACPDAIADRVQGYTADLIVEPFAGDRLTLDNVDPLVETAADRDITVLGPGLGEAGPTIDAVRRFLETAEGRVIVDADALQAVPDVDTAATLICTPHQGELREMGGPSAEDWSERATAVETFARDLGHTLLVKGRYDVISDGTTTRVNRTGNPGMTVGGTGDVLAGVTAAMACRRSPVEAAAIGAYVNGAAGDAVVAEQGYGLVASDLLSVLPSTIRGETDE
ncbi:MAG: NAD(P)H-hydrate dehydratase [Halobacteriales archaeon]|nr:NAD(P)H-hydrate dehydratase [Halobacteriales archaeon]